MYKRQARAIEAVEKDADIEIDGRITVVDGKKAKMYMKNFGEFFKDQVEHASTIVVSRTQMMTDEKVEECVHTLREENAEATIISTPWDELGKEAISHALTKGAEIESLFEDHEDHDHDHCDHDQMCIRDSLNPDLLTPSAHLLTTISSDSVSCSISIFLIFIRYISSVVPFTVEYTP